MSTVTLPQLPWHGTKELKLALPDGWQVKYYYMNGWNRPAMTPESIKAAVTNPSGIASIRESARGKKEVVIIFDDMSRVTRVAGIIPFVLEELAAAGISENKIRFVCALGCHGAHNRLDFNKKLGKEITLRYPVYNHNPFAHCTYVGTTNTYGTEVYINEEVMKSDFKIAIGLVTPHPASGFGGGGKIILPGVTSFETTEYNHRKVVEDVKAHPENPIIGMGFFEKNTMRLDIEEAAGMAGLDVLINCIVNMWGETVSVFAGALMPTYAAAVDEAKSHYNTPRAAGEGIVIANTFTKANEAIAVGLGTAFAAISPQGGDIVLIANAPDGQVTHYLLGPFGNQIAAGLQFRTKVPRHVKRVSIFSEYPDVAGRYYIEESDKVSFESNWDDVVKSLQDSAGKDARVAVYPGADIQYTI